MQPNKQMYNTPWRIARLFQEDVPGRRFLGDSPRPGIDCLAASR